MKGEPTLENDPQAAWNKSATMVHLVPAILNRVMQLGSNYLLRMLTVKYSWILLLQLVLAGLISGCVAGNGDSKHKIDTSETATNLAALMPLADQGNKNAQFNLGKAYHIGLGVPKDYQKAVLWYRKAADQGEANAQTNLAFLYDLRNRGEPQDYGKAAFWYRKAADQGHSNAQTNLAYLYQTGHGVPKEYRQAEMWYRRAANQGYANAQANLASLYAQGLGVPQDFRLAFD